MFSIFEGLTVNGVGGYVDSNVYKIIASLERLWLENGMIQSFSENKLKQFNKLETRNS